MPEIIDYVFLFLFGALGGFLAGLLGIGGGIIYVVVLRFYLSRYNLPDEELVKFILSNSIIGTFFAGMAGSIKQLRKKYFFAREVGFTAIGGVVASMGITASIVAWHWYSAEKFTFFFITVLILIAINFLVVRKKKLPIEEPAGDIEEPVSDKKANPFGLLGVGVFAGAFSALSGLGGGVIMVPILNKMLKFDLRKSASISLGIIPFQAAAVGLYYGFSSSPLSDTMPLTFGYVVLPLLIPMLLGVIVGSPQGVRLAHRLSPNYIRIIFGLLIFVVVIQTLYEYFKG